VCERAELVELELGIAKSNLPKTAARQSEGAYQGVVKTQSNNEPGENLRRAGVTGDGDGRGPDAR
jgi:hypothetical protein